jgi:hypothetical protein
VNGWAGSKNTLVTACPSILIAAENNMVVIVYTDKNLKY